MSTLLTPAASPPPREEPLQPAAETIADLLAQLGGVPATRVRYFPRPGTATDQDVIQLEARDGRLFELVDDTLVEKPLGYQESVLAGRIIQLLLNFVEPRNLGWVSSPDGMMRIVRRQVRMPDVGYLSRGRAPGGRPPTGPIADVSPDLAVEVLSVGNTVAEMDRKRQEYFEGGTRLVWQVDPVERTIAIYRNAVDTPDVLRGSDVLIESEVLPGFSMSLAELFATLDE